MHTTLALLAAMTFAGPLDPPQNRNTFNRAAPVRTVSGKPVTDAQIKHCIVSSIQEVQVPAQESGPLTMMKAIEGKPVEPEQLLALIDDRQAQLDKTAAEAQHKAALAQSQDDVEIRFAEASFAVADAELEQNLDINRRSPGSVPLSEIRRLRLTRRKAELQIDKAKLDQKVSGLNASVEKAKVDSADAAIGRRRILSPIKGVVATIHRQQGEWVAAGDPVLHIIHMDELYVEGFLSAADFNPSEVKGRQVSVTVPLARGRQIQLSGQVVHAGLLLQAGNKYRVRAKVKNQQENQQWLLRPGSTAEMTIHFQQHTARPRFPFPR